MSKRDLRKKNKDGFKEFFQKWKFHFAVFVFSFLIYANTIPNRYNLDDELVTSVSPSMQHRLTSKGIAAIPEIFSEPYYKDNQGYAYEYRPVVLATFAIEHSLFGDNPHLSHLINVLLYALLCVLLFITLSRLFKEYHPWLALLTTLFFAAHPIHTEVVASIKNRDEILSLMGGIGSLLFFSHYAERKKILPLLFAAICFAAGMLSKQSIISFLVIGPALLVLLAQPTLKQILLISAILCAIAYPFIQTIFLDERLAILGGSILFSAAIYQIRNPAILKVISGWWKVWSDFKNKIAGEFKPDESSNYFHFGNRTTALLFITLAVLTTVLLFFSPVFHWISLLGFFPLCAFAHPRVKIYLTWLCLGVAVYITYRTENAPAIIFLFLFFIYNLVTERNRKIQSFIIILLLFASTPPSFQSTETVVVFIIIAGAAGMAFTSYFAWFKWLALFIIMLQLLIGPLADFNSFKAGLFQLTVIYYLVVILIFFSAKRRALIVSLITLSVLAVLLTNASLLRVSFDTPHYKKIFVTPGSYTYRPIDYAENVVDAIKTPFREKAGTGMVIIGKYMRLTAIPYPMSFYYGYKIIEKEDIAEPLPLFIAITVILLAGSAFFCFNKAPVLSASLFIYLVSIFSVANIFASIPGMMADRFLFIPSLGFSMMLGYLLLKFSPGKKADGFSISSLSVFAKYSSLAILALCSGVTIARNTQWRNPLTLMRHDIRHLDESAQAQNLLATHLVRRALDSKDDLSRQRLLGEAELHYERAASVYPEFFNAWYDLGRVRMMLGKHSEAETAFLKVIGLDSTFSAPLFQLGLAKVNRGDYRGATTYFRKYAEKNPGNFDVLNNLSFCYVQLHDFQNALAPMKEAMSWYPKSHEPLVNLSRIFLDAGISDSAKVYLQRAEMLAPNHPDVILLRDALGKSE